jgi:hypothetical protein
MTHRAAGACLVVGAVIFGGFRILHGDLPANDPQAALEFIQHRPIYELVHLSTIAGLLVLVGGFVMLAGRLTRATDLARLATTSAQIGAAVFIVDFTIDGVTGHDLAEAYAAAPRPELVQAAGTAFAMLRGTSLTSLVILLGLPLVLFGVALVRQGYPAWLGWSGVVLGAGTTLAATLLLFDADLFDGVVLYGLLASILVPLWIVVLGVTAWRSTTG